MNKRFRLRSVLLLAATLLTARGLAAAQMAAVSAAPKLTLVMITDQNGLGDQGFNDMTWAGLQKAAADFNAEAKVIESSEQAQYVPNLTSAVNDKAGLVVAVGFLLADAVKEVAAANPGAHFALVDASVEAANVRGLVFKEQEGAFLGGIIAGMTTKRNHIGVVGGMEVPPVIRWVAGFKAGVKTVNPQTEVRVTYAGSFADPAKGKEIALAQYDQGADVVFEVAGGTGIGAFQAAAERGAGVYVFGSDRCKFDLAPNNALPDVTKRVDSAVHAAAQEVAAGKFSGGTLALGLKEGGMGFCERTYAKTPAHIKALVVKAQDLIIAGTLVPPTTMETLAAFRAPDLSK